MRVWFFCWFLICQRFFVTSFLQRSQFIVSWESLIANVFFKDPIAVCQSKFIPIAVYQSEHHLNEWPKISNCETFWKVIYLDHFLFFHYQSINFTSESFLMVFQMHEFEYGLLWLIFLNLICVDFLICQRFFVTSFLKRSRKQLCYFFQSLTTIDFDMIIVWK